MDEITATAHATRHARLRAMERYGRADEELIEEILRRIKQREKYPDTVTMLQRRNQWHRSVWRVVIDGETYCVVRNHKTNKIVSFLPPNALGDSQPDPDEFVSPNYPEAY